MVWVDILIQTKTIYWRSIMALTVKKAAAKKPAAKKAPAKKAAAKKPAAKKAAAKKPAAKKAAPKRKATPMINTPFTTGMALSGRPRGKKLLGNVHADIPAASATVIGNSHTCVKRSGGTMLPAKTPSTPPNEMAR